jgi:hypothetical protein
VILADSTETYNRVRILLHKVIAWTEWNILACGLIFEGWTAMFVEAGYDTALGAHGRVQQTLAAISGRQQAAEC